MAGAPHILIVEARYYEDISDALLRGAEEAFQAAGATFERLAVPGAFEVPAAIARAVEAGRAGRTRYDGYLALGCVIRGETSHYDYICAESARKLQDLACDQGAALGYGILTCETHEQAWARARVDGRNKGGEAARACLAMIAVNDRVAGRRE
ncbi:MAG TPA: 6,7-dimethyl-8-ribityllumazine synthase [Kiloniellales bacterium]